MSELSPKNLDKLFRQGSEQYDFEYNPEAWEQMEDLLDKDKRRRRFFWWWFGGIGILVLVGAIYFLKNDQSELVLTHSNIEKTAETTTENTALSTTTSNEKNAEIQSSSDLKTQSVNTKTGIHRPTLFDTKNKQTLTSEKADESDEITPSFPIAKAPTFKLGTHNATILSDSLFEKPPKDSTDFLEKNYLADPQKNTEKSDEISRLSHLPIAFFMTDFSKNIRADVSDFDFGNNDKTPPKNAVLLVGTVLGGELSSVGIDNFSTFNWKLGGQLEYRYGKKYSTSIGANYMRLKYKAGAGEYIPPKGFWTRKIPPTATDGTCDILEVPVWLGFYSESWLKNSFVIKMGLTSYFMLRERYNYFYDLPDPDLIREWGTKNENRHWFGIGQISLGYQFFAMEKMSVEVAPYFQIPLQGIGHGQVKLWSIGVEVRTYFWGRNGSIIN